MHFSFNAYIWQTNFCTKDGNNGSLEKLQKLVYAKTSEEFDLMHRRSEENVKKLIVDYFNQNW